MKKQFLAIIVSVVLFISILSYLSYLSLMHDTRAHEGCVYDTVYIDSTYIESFLGTYEYIADTDSGFVKVVIDPDTVTVIGFYKYKRYYMNDSADAIITIDYHDGDTMYSVYNWFLENSEIYRK